MFTGIIQQCGIIKTIHKRPHALTIAIQSQYKDLNLGDSIAVDGACLTVAQIQDNIFSCDVSEETGQKTIIPDYQIGQIVNLERALKATDYLGGHWVTGHVHGTTAVKLIEIQSDFKIMEFYIPSAKENIYLIPKGSVAINGVSLTINKKTTNSFSLTLIPHTLAHTNLNGLIKNQRVNIEFDLLTTTIVNTIHEIKAYDLITS